MFIQALLFMSSIIAIKPIINLYANYSLRKELEEKEKLLNIEILKVVTESLFIHNLNLYKENIIAASNENHFLELVLKSFPIDLSNNNFEKQQAELITFAINKGATYLFEIRKNFNPVSLETLEYLKTLVEDGIFPASYFLRQVILSYKYNKSYKLIETDKEELFYELVKFAIEHNADVNTIIIGDIPILQLVENLKVYKLLEENGAECSIFSQNLKKIIQAIDLLESDILKFPKELHESLLAKKRTYVEMPELIHHVWLTSESNPKEISQSDLSNILKTKSFFTERMKGNWNQIIWVNNKNLIPDSVVFLEENNIEIKSIDDCINDIRLYNQIKDSISQGKLVMAADLLRYSVIEHLGGIYADLNYEFLNEFNFEVSKYDFFANSLVNSFFMAKPHHPIIRNEINFLEKLFNDEYEHLLWLKYHGNTKEQTMLTTAYTFAYNVIKYINTQNNIDFVNPNFQSNLSFEYFTCKINLEAYTYANLMEYCSNPLTLTGIDDHSDWTS